MLHGGLHNQSPLGPVFDALQDTFRLASLQGADYLSYEIGLRLTAMDEVATRPPRIGACLQPRGEFTLTPACEAAREGAN